MEDWLSQARKVSMKTAREKSVEKNNAFMEIGRWYEGGFLVFGLSGFMVLLGRGDFFRALKF